MKFSYKELFKPKPIKLSVYFMILLSIIVFITTSIFASLILLRVKYLIGTYEITTNNLRQSLSRVLVQSIKLDAERKDFTSTKQIIELLKRDGLLSYAYVKDNNNNSFILGKDGKKHRELPKFNTQDKIDNKSFSIDNHTVYFGMPNKDSSELFFGEIYNILGNILMIYLAIGIIASLLMSDIFSRTLKKLSTAAEGIAKGDFSTKIKNSNFAEINDLITSYNEMGQQLNELYTSLEQKVKERTEALADANYQLKEAQAMMVHSEKMRSLGELVAGIAHEINNPINFIHGNIMILQNYTDDLIKLIDFYEENSGTIPDDIKAKIKDLRKQIDLDFLRDDVKDLIKSCIEGTQRTKNIILDLKNFSRMEEQVLTQFDIPKEIDTTLNILNNKYKNRITVIKEYEDNLPKIEAYGGQLNQVFMNILDNAQGAMKETGTLTIKISTENQNVKIQFTDTGCGIPKENLSKVFDPFFTTKPVGKGTGLGMSISYKVISNHNGTIEVESEVGVGTTFTIKLPINHPMEKNVESSSNETV